MRELCIRTTSLDLSLWAGDHIVPIKWAKIWEEAETLMDAISRALQENRYPEETANSLALHLAPSGSGSSLTSHLLGRDRLRFFSDAAAAALPLELLPVSGGGWLDLRQPIYRALIASNSFSFEVQRVPQRRSVALLYQYDNAEVKEMVLAEQRGLYPLLTSLGLHVKCFTAGELFCGRTTPDTEVVRSIFRNYACVIFIGNGDHTRLGRSKGWVIDARRGLILTRSNIVDAFHLSRSALGKERHTVCDLVFSNSCCSGAVPPRRQEAEPEGEDLPGVPRTFPELFQALGVRHYVGTLSEVSVRPDLTMTLLSTFFQRWAAAPDGVVEHLFNAKQAVHQKNGSPHLQTALYQVFQDSREHVPYAAEVELALKAVEPDILPPVPKKHFHQQPKAVEVEVVVERSAELPPMLSARGPVVGLVQASDVLLADGRRWVVGEPLANDVCGIWYQARTGDDCCLVQVLADELCDNLPPDLEAVMVRTIRQLAALSLPEWHLCPTAFAMGELCREGVARPLATAVPVLFYLRKDAAETWSALADEPLGRSQVQLPEFLHRVLDWGHDAARRLEELHGKGLAHGNVFPGSFMVRRGTNAGMNGTLVLKDTWLALALRRRLVPRRYAAPDLWLGQATTAMDVHGLGLVLYELACGVEAFGESSALSGLPEPMSQVLGQAAPEVDGLERCVRDCLVPDERLRPPAQALSRRLFIAWTMGGHYLSDFANAVHEIVQAERRLIVVANAVELGEVWRSLITLTAGPQPALPPAQAPAPKKPDIVYELLVIREGEGMSRWLRALGAENTLSRWETAAALQGIYGQTLTAEEVAMHNALQLFSALSSLPSPRHTIVLIEGAGWWARQLGSGGSRLLREAVKNGGPVIVIADATAELHYDLLMEAARVRFPDPSRAVIYEEVVKFCTARSIQMDVDDAVSLALRFAQAGCTLKEVRLCLRLCWLAHGVVDARAGGMLEGQRARRLQQPGLQLVPAAELPLLDDYHLPSLLADRVRHWLAGVQTRATVDFPTPVPATIGVLGRAGAGRTCLVRHLAARLGWQLAQLRPGRCAGRELGSGERNLRQALQALASVGPAVVLIEADEEWPSHITLNRGPALRLVPILVDWLKHLPRHLVVVVVATPDTQMPRELASAVQLWLPPLPACDGAMLTGLLGTLFSRHQLSELAQDAAFLDRLAAALSRSQRRAWAPEAGLIGPVQAVTHTRALVTSAEVSVWFADTLRVHAVHGSPLRESSFWLRRFDLATPFSQPLPPPHV